MAKAAEGYLKKLRKRAKDSRVYRKYQMIGLRVAQILEDEKHKSLYIKLAKNNDHQALMRLAKDVGDRAGVKNKGAYFMFLLKKSKQNGR